jgi:hypothetical protein
VVKDKYHNLVRQSLENEGWVITHDPFKISIGKRRDYIDLGAEKEIIAAEKEEEKIAVEIKSFSEPSDLYSNKIDFSIATGLQTRCYGKIALFFKKPLNFEYRCF